MLMSAEIARSKMYELNKDKYDEELIKIENAINDNIGEGSVVLKFGISQYSISKLKEKGYSIMLYPNQTAIYWGSNE